MSVQFLQVHYEESPLPVEDKLENEQILCSSQITHPELIWKWLNTICSVKISQKYRTPYIYYS